MAASSVSHAAPMPHGQVYASPVSNWVRSACSSGQIVMVWSTVYTLHGSTIYRHKEPCIATSQDYNQQWHHLRARRGRVRMSINNWQVLVCKCNSLEAPQAQFKPKIA